MSYETLDSIADSYIPLLLILFLLGLAGKTYQLWPNHRAPLSSFFYLLGLLVIVYGLMFLDKAIRLWPALSLDYSTHTALALALVFSLCNLFPKYWKWFVVSILVYAGLMLYQQYHSVMDILSTSLVIGISAIFLNKFLGVRSPW